MKIENTKKCIAELKKLGYTQRSINFLLCYEVKNTDDIKDITAKEMSKFRNMGKATIVNLLNPKPSKSEVFKLKVGDILVTECNKKGALMEGEIFSLDKRKGIIYYYDDFNKINRTQVIDLQTCSTTSHMCDVKRSIWRKPKSNEKITITLLRDCKGFVDEKERCEEREKQVDSQSSKQQAIDEANKAEKEWLKTKALNYEVAKFVSTVRFYVREHEDRDLFIKGNQYYTYFSIYNKNKDREYQHFLIRHNPNTYKFDVTCYIHNSDNPIKNADNKLGKGILPEFKSLLKDYEHLLIIK